MTRAVSFPCFVARVWGSSGRELRLYANICSSQHDFARCPADDARFKTCPKYCISLPNWNWHQTLSDPSQTLFVWGQVFSLALSLSLSLLHFAKFRLEHLRTYSLYRRLTGSYWINFERTVREEQLLMTKRLIHIHQRRYVRSQICAAQITDLIWSHVVLGCLDIWQRNGSQRWMPQIYSQVQRRVLRPFEAIAAVCCGQWKKTVLPWIAPFWREQNWTVFEHVRTVNDFEIKREIRRMKDPEVPRNSPASFSIIQPRSAMLWGLSFASTWMGRLRTFQSEEVTSRSTCLLWQPGVPGAAVTQVVGEMIQFSLQIVDLNWGLKRQHFAATRERKVDSIVAKDKFWLSWLLRLSFAA